MADLAVRELYTRLLQAWNDHDAAAYAALFVPDGAIVGFDGSQATGGEILAHLRSIFEDHPTGSYVGKVRQVRQLGPDAVLLRAIAGMVPPGQRELKPAVHAVHTVVAARQDDGAWRIVLFQNTPAQYHGRPELTAEHTAELAPLVSARTPVAGDSDLQRVSD